MNATSEAVERLLVISTCHITREVSKYDNDDACFDGIVWEPVNYGYFIRYWTPATDEEREEHWEMWPECIRSVIKVAENLRCNRVLLDQDGPEIADIPTYDW